MKNMKKNFVLLIAFSMALYATSQARFELGAKLGANISSASIGGGDFSANSFTSIHGGLFTLLKIGNIGIQPELLFSRQGTELSISTSPDPIQYKFSYLNVPILIKFYLPLGINFQGGPQIGFLQDTEIKGDTANVMKTFNVIKKFLDNDFAIALGLGWDAPFGLQFNIRYVIGLTDIVDEQGGSLMPNSLPNSFASLKNTSFQVSLGYRIFKVGN